MTLEPWVATSVAKVFDAMGLSYSRTEKSGSPMFTKQFLANQTHPIAQKIIKIREINKANTTFVDTILEHSHNGRIHCDFHPLDLTVVELLQVVLVQVTPICNKYLHEILRSKN